jgi:hypothetical protein
VYLSHARSFLFDLGSVAGVSAVLREKEEHALNLASRKQWKRLKSSQTLTGIVLTLSKGDVCNQLLLWSATKNLSSTACSLSAVGIFYSWLEAQELIQANNFEEVRKMVELRSSKLRPSIVQALRS